MKKSGVRLISVVEGPSLVGPLRAERQSARMSKIANDSLTRSGT